MNGVVDDDQVQNLGAGGGYVTNRWYHLEIRSNARQHAIFIDGRQVFTYTDNSEMPFVSGSVGFYAANENGLAFDDALVTKLGEAGCMVNVNDLVTYTLTISNQERLVGHNLVISDVLPPLSLAYAGYSMASSDPAATVTAAPAPGTLGTLVWNVDQLAPLTPFDPLTHGWLVLTVTARIVGDVSAGVRLPNQALPTYDGQAANGPDGVQRSYSGGSHSTGIRTPSVALLKATSPAIVTIGQRLNYTLTLPAVGGLPATLYTATVTDAVPSGFRFILPPLVSWSPDTIAPGDVDVSRSTTKTVLGGLFAHSFQHGGDGRDHGGGRECGGQPGRRTLHQHGHAGLVRSRRQRAAAPDLQRRQHAPGRTAARDREGGRAQGCAPGRRRLLSHPCLSCGDVHGPRLQCRHQRHRASRPFLYQRLLVARQRAGRTGRHRLLHRAESAPGSPGSP